MLYRFIGNRQRLYCLMFVACAGSHFYNRWNKSTLRPTIRHTIRQLLCNLQPEQKQLSAATETVIAPTTKIDACRVKQNTNHGMEPDNGEINTGIAMPAASLLINT